MQSFGSDFIVNRLSINVTLILVETLQCYGIQCLNGGTLTTETNTCVCKCSPEYSGILCEYSKYTRDETFTLKLD